MASFFLDCMHNLIFKLKADEVLKTSFHLHARKLALSCPGAMDCLHHYVHADGKNNDYHDLEMDSDNGEE